MCHFYRSLRDAMWCVHGASISQKGLLLLPDSGDVGASLVAQLVKNPPAMQETSVWSLGLEDPMEGGAWQATVHGVAKSRRQLSNTMATHSSVLAWRIPGTGEPGGLPSMGSHRVRHD